MWRSLDFHAMQFGAVPVQVLIDGWMRPVNLLHRHPLVPVAECWAGTDLTQKAHIELVITIALFDEKPSWASSTVQGVFATISMSYPRLWHSAQSLSIKGQDI